MTDLFQYQDMDGTRAQSAVAHRLPTRQPRTTRLLPPPYGSFHPSRAAAIATHPLLQLPSAGSRLTAAPALPVIVVTDPDGDHRALNLSHCPPPPRYTPSQRTDLLASAVEASRGQAHDMLEGVRARTNPHLSGRGHAALFLELPHRAFHRQNEMYFRPSCSPPPRPLPEVVTAFKDQPSRNAVCDVCNGRNRTGMSCCTVCTWHCCHDCTIRNGLRRYHRAGGMVHIAPVTHEELQLTSFSPLTKLQKRRIETEARRRLFSNHGQGGSTRDEAAVVGATGAHQSEGAGVGNPFCINPEPVAQDAASNNATTDAQDSEEEAGVERAAGAHLERTPYGELLDAAASAQAQHRADVQAGQHSCGGASSHELTSTAPARRPRFHVTSEPARHSHARTLNEKPIYTDEQLAHAGELLTFAGAAAKIQRELQGTIHPGVKSGPVSRANKRLCVYITAGRIPDHDRLWELASVDAQAEIASYKRKQSLEVLEGRNATVEDAIQAEAEGTVAPVVQDGKCLHLFRLILVLEIEANDPPANMRLLARRLL